MLRRIVAAALVLLLASACGPDAGSVGGRLARTWRDRAADREGALVIYANTGELESAPLLEAFRKRHPKIAVTFVRLNSSELYDRYVAESATGPSADMVWSSAMDMQIKLINDGYAQSYVSMQKDALPTWAVWKDQGYGVTAEPIVFVYDKRRLAPAQVPDSHADLLSKLEAHQLPGAVGGYDPEHSGVGFLYYSQDRSAWSDTLALSRAIGAQAPRLYTSTATLLDAVQKGEIILGYNVIGSYALELQRQDRNLVVAFPKDYTLVMSRIAFISAKARHPHAAQLFLDFILSEAGQRLLARSSLQPVRTDLAGAGVPGPSPAVARPIEVGPALLANLDQMRRAHLLEEWRRAIGPRREYDSRRIRDNMMTGKAP
jgi:iron(III) transport system substrate-binding protein